MEQTIQITKKDLKQIIKEEIQNYFKKNQIVIKENLLLNYPNKKETK